MGTETMIWRWNDWPIALKAGLAVVIPIVLMMAALFSSFQLQQQVAQADAEVRRALAIKNDIQALHIQLAEAATAVRGYLLTERDDFLNPYREARAALPATIRSLREKVRDPVVSAHLDRVEQKLDDKLASLDTLMTNRDRFSPEEMQTHLVDSKQLLDLLRNEVRDMRAREIELIERFTADARDALKRNLWVDVLTSLLVLLSAGIAGRLLFSAVVTRIRRLAVNGERLARGEQLEDLPTGRDELGILAERLNNTSLLLARRAEEAQEANLAKSRFLSRTSHELRTPLTAILGFADLLLREAESPAQKTRAQHIVRAGQHLLTMIEDVLDIARIEAGELRLSVQPVAVLPIFREVCDLLKARAEKEGVQLLAPEVRGPLVVHADPGRLRQVLVNLVDNAIKYNRPGGSVWLSANPHDDQLIIRVIDNGIGISLDKRDRLFTPFDRLDVEAHGIEGTGLGLSLSLQLVKEQGGSLQLLDGRDGGIEARLVLPLAQADDQQTQAARRSPAPNPVTPLDQKKRTLWLLDDDPSRRLLLQTLIQRRPDWQLRDWPAAGLPQATDRVIVLASRWQELPEIWRPQAIALTDVALPEASQTLALPLAVAPFLALLETPS